MIEFAKQNMSFEKKNDSRTNRQLKSRTLFEAVRGVRWGVIGKARHGFGFVEVWHQLIFKLFVPLNAHNLCYIFANYAHIRDFTRLNKKSTIDEKKVFDYARTRFGKEIA